MVYAIRQTITGGSDTISTVDRLSIGDGRVKVLYHNGAKTTRTGKGHAATAAAANGLSFDVQVRGANSSDCLCHNQMG